MYWNIKKDHFDHIVFWRKGDWYVTFFGDSVILNQVTDKITRTVNSEIGFYKNRIDDFIKLLTDYGYKVIRCEQTETGLQRDKRNEKEREEKGEEAVDEVVRREVFSISTKGTYIPH